MRESHSYINHQPVMLCVVTILQTSEVTVLLETPSHELLAGREGEVSVSFSLYRPVSNSGPSCVTICMITKSRWKGNITRFIVLRRTG
jgi:hypothetical protein